MSKQRQVFVVYWEQEDGVWATDFLSENTPDEVKRMIAQRLLDDLKIQVRLT